LILINTFFGEGKKEREGFSRPAIIKDGNERMILAIKDYFNKFLEDISSGKWYQKGNQETKKSNTH
jgi:hypothetical protein